MAIRLNEASRASVGSTDAPNRVLDDSVSSDQHAQGRQRRKTVYITLRMRAYP